MTTLTQGRADAARPKPRRLAFPERPPGLKRWNRDKSRGASLHAWPVAGTRRAPNGKDTLYAWRIRYTDAALRGKSSELIWATGWHQANTQANDRLAGRVEAGTSDTPHANNENDSGLSLQKVFELCMAVKESDTSKTRLRTVANYRKEWAVAIAPTFGERGIKTITGDDLTKWMASKSFLLCHHKRKAGAQPERAKSRTRAKRLALLQLVFKWALRRHYVDRLPFTDEHVVHVLKAGEKGKGKLRGDQRVGATVDLDEVEAAVDWLDDRTRNGGEGDPVFQDPVPLIAIRVAAYAGLRLRELVHVQEQDVNEDGRFIWIESGRKCGCPHCKSDGAFFHTKNSADRLVPVAPELAPVLAAYLVQRRQGPADSDGVRWLFPVWRTRYRTKAKPGDQRRPECFTEQWQRAAKWGLDREDVVLHDLRRTAYTHLFARSGGKVTLVKLAVGHRLDVLEQTYNKTAEQPEFFYRSLFVDWKPKEEVARAEVLKSKLKRSRAVA